MAQGYMQLVIAVDGWTESNRLYRICEGLTRANPAHAPGVHGSPSRYRLLFKALQLAPGETLYK